MTCVLDGLLACEQATGGSPESVAARRREEQYLLERRLFRRLSTGKVVQRRDLKFSFPAWWHYDVLRALDYFRAVGAERTANRKHSRIVFLGSKTAATIRSYLFPICLTYANADREEIWTTRAANEVQRITVHKALRDATILF